MTVANIIAQVMAKLDALNAMLGKGKTVQKETIAIITAIVMATSLVFWSPE